MIIFVHNHWSQDFYYSDWYLHVAGICTFPMTNSLTTNVTINNYRRNGIRILKSVDDITSEFISRTLAIITTCISKAFYSLLGSPGVWLPDYRIRVEFCCLVSRKRPISRFLEGYRKDCGNDDGRVRVWGPVQQQEEYFSTNYKQNRIFRFHYAR